MERGMEACLLPPWAHSATRTNLLPRLCRAQPSEAASAVRFVQRRKPQSREDALWSRMGESTATWQDTSAGPSSLEPLQVPRGQTPPGSADISFSCQIRSPVPSMSLTIYIHACIYSFLRYFTHMLNVYSMPGSHLLGAWDTAVNKIGKNTSLNFCFTGES